MSSQPEFVHFQCGFSASPWRSSTWSSLVPQALQARWCWSIWRRRQASSTPSADGTKASWSKRLLRLVVEVGLWQLNMCVQVTQVLANPFLDPITRFLVSSQGCLFDSILNSLDDLRNVAFPTWTTLEYCSYCFTKERTMSSNASWIEVGMYFPKNDYFWPLV